MGVGRRIRGQGIFARLIAAGGAHGWTDLARGRFAGAGGLAVSRAPVSCRIRYFGQTVGKSPARSSRHGGSVASAVVLVLALLLMSGLVQGSRA